MLKRKKTTIVFAMYMPCDTIQQGNNFNRRLVSVGGFEDAGYTYGKLKSKASVSAQFINNFQLLLTPLASITDEHAIEVAKMEYTEDDLPRTDTNRSYTGYGIISRKFNSEIFQQLIIWGYAVPLYFGLNHRANGKTAIELNLAISKPHQP